MDSQTTYAEDDDAENESSGLVILEAHMYSRIFGLAQVVAYIDKSKEKKVRSTESFSHYPHGGHKIAFRLLGPLIYQ